METQESSINNAFYDHIDWYDAIDHPVALLRAENALRNPWIAEMLVQRGKQGCSVLDIGCGAGFLTNYLAKQGYRVSGIDLSTSSLQEARRRDETGSVSYHSGNATSLPFADQSFDVVTAMDLLEHVEQPDQVIREAARVLKKGGLFFFHTFNRNLLSYLLIIKGVDWFLPNAPKNMHVYSLFIKPKELEKMCAKESLIVEEMRGVKPVINLTTAVELLRDRKINLNFAFTPNLKTGYCGVARSALGYGTVAEPQA